jgi:hypothetical protein
LDSSAESGSRIHAIQRKEAAKADFQDKPHASVPDSDLEFLRDHIRKIEDRLYDANGMHRERLEEELRRARDVIEKVKLLDKVKAQALIEEEKQRLALMQRVVERIKFQFHLLFLRCASLSLSSVRAGVAWIH